MGAGGCSLALDLKDELFGAAEPHSGCDRERMKIFRKCPMLAVERQIRTAWSLRARRGVPPEALQRKQALSATVRRLP